MNPQRITQPSSIAVLLETHHLPSQDLAQANDSYFWGLGSPEYYAAIGLERYGSEGLLRSLVVDVAKRGQGLGRELVAWVEQYAQDEGIKQLYLLTTTAKPFFETLGYQSITRAQLPTSIQSTSQVQGVCPTSADILMKSFV
ncbi:MAG: GNAT family N-acetyltransferase [Thiothrix sp.]|nr:MAG: GNAT family N-acetyltransferase [Thiothrix sp.]